MEATVTNWVEHLTASEVAGQIYPYVGTEWLWLSIAVIGSHGQLAQLLAKLKNKIS